MLKNFYQKLLDMFYLFLNFILESIKQTVNPNLFFLVLFLFDP